MLTLREENKILSFHSSIFHSKFYKRRGTYFDRIVCVGGGGGGGGVNSLKQTYVGKRIHVKRTWSKKGRGGQYLKF